MNIDTVNLIERPYLEVVDDLLVAMVGGVVNEPIIFDVKSDLYPLSQPARDVRGITGTIDAEIRPNSEFKPDGEHHTFLKEVDFIFNPDKSAVVWQDGGKKPKDETTFYVDYFVPASRSPLSDLNVGSVTRTLSEAIGREIAAVYQQINLTYLSGFIDTAEGKSLDFVVSILGVTRKTKEFAEGQVTFFRDPSVDGNITIPQGTELTTIKGDAVFETKEPRTLQRGQARIDAPIRAGEKFKGDKGKVGAGQITTPLQVIAGISRVTNFDPTALAAEDESDDDLRSRAKAAIRALGKATILALIKAVADADSDAKIKEISDPNTAVKQTPPGKVSMLIDTKVARFPSVAAAVHDTRAAGIELTIAAFFVFVTLRVNAKIPSGTTGDGKLKFANEIIASLQEYIEGLKAGASATGADLLGAIKKVKDVKDPKIIDVRTARSDVGRPGSSPLVEALVARLETVNVSSTDALRVAVEETIKTEGPTLVASGRRIADRDLVKSTTRSPQRANDGEIESLAFVITPPDGFSLALDMEPSDIVLQEA